MKKVKKFTVEQKLLKRKKELEQELQMLRSKVKGGIFGGPSSWDIQESIRLTDEINWIERQLLLCE